MLDVRGSRMFPGWNHTDVFRACALCWALTPLLLSSAFLTRSEQPVHALLSLSGFYCSFHLGPLPLHNRHAEDLIHWILQTQMSFIFRPNNRIDSSDTAHHSTGTTVPRTGHVLSERKRLAVTYSLLCFLP